MVVTAKENGLFIGFSLLRLETQQNKNSKNKQNKQQQSQFYHLCFISDFSVSQNSLSAFSWFSTSFEMDY